MNTKKKKQPVKKPDMQRTRDIASMIGIFNQYLPSINNNGNIPLFSREFLLKNLFGFTDEEYEENNRQIESETMTILSSLDFVKNISENQTNLSKKQDNTKTKEKVN